MVYARENTYTNLIYKWYVSNTPWGEAGEFDEDGNSNLKYLHKDGTWHTTTNNAENQYPGYFASLADILKLANSLELDVQVDQ